jgi:hypothetical protein
VVRVISWAGVEPWTGAVTFEGPEAFQPARTETWTLFCEDRTGTIRSARPGLRRPRRAQRIDLRNDCGSGSDEPAEVRDEPLVLVRRVSRAHGLDQQVVELR